jgi:hypothetical protein
MDAAQACVFRPGIGIHFRREIRERCVTARRIRRIRNFRPMAFDTAQLATFVRQGGYDTGWFHDILLNDAME